ncbi:transcriptional regulator NrdR, partial [Candidatus Woesebacteria bacterium]|nr:transcriptional regulator NrdR [Candidatus Woesebacteria bacterium]
FKAVGKTTVTADQVEAIVSEIEQAVTQNGKSEVSSGLIGDMVAKQLKDLDKVAYIRFASVFRRFVDVEEFEKELKKLA